ncbi:MAG: ABC transporter ATP-binding protein [Oligoflexia bacterium]|nr:MAG: ABC transporter ATP-binding protein [Oligoflexia bacterium]
MLDHSKVLLEFKNISKTFGSVQANANVTFQIQAGSIHAIVGENGAGKSTIMKILFGLYQPDQGKIILRGKSATISSPSIAKQLGIGMVHQHFMLAGPLIALDHIFLDERTDENLFFSLLAPLKRKKLYGELNYLSQKYRMPVPWNKKIQDLSVGIHQRIEILKLLHNQSEILILDEPTAVLTPQEVEEFFKQLRALKAAGKTIIIITHKLKEVLALADQVTVMRQGKVTHSGSIQDQTIESLSELMIGRKLQHTEHSSQRIQNSKSILSIKNLSYNHNGLSHLSDVSIEVYPGEIVGIAGVEGNGQSELLQILTRPQSISGKISGSAQLKGVEISMTPAHQIRELGLNYLAEDRIHQAILTESPAPDNYLLGQQWRSDFKKNGLIQTDLLLAKTKKGFEDFDVRPRDLSLPLGKFSGGNQQKFVVGREIEQNPDLLIAAQPTRGVDIGATESIHQALIDLTKKQKSVLLVSSDLDETLKLSDRIYVIFRGKIAAELKSTEFDENRIGCLMGGLVQ